MFRPYSFERNGSLEDYLRSHNGTNADNHFYGPTYFLIIRNRGYMLPLITTVRVDQSPAPDLGFFVNVNFLLESNGPGEYNMSLVGAEKGVYDPLKVLMNRNWSIQFLNI
jgi:hypothetical protein